MQQPLSWHTRNLRLITCGGYQGIRGLENAVIGLILCGAPRNLDLVLDGFLGYAEKGYKVLIHLGRVSSADSRFCGQSSQRGSIHLFRQPCRHVRRTTLTGATYLPVHDCSSHRVNHMGPRSRHLGIFPLPPTLNKAAQNLYLLPAILFPFRIIFIFCYIFGLQNVANSSYNLAEYFFPWLPGWESCSLMR